jgi:hypothetical protein
MLVLKHNSLEFGGIKVRVIDKYPAQPVYASVHARSIGHFTQRRIAIAAGTDQHVACGSPGRQSIKRIKRTTLVTKADTEGKNGSLTY